MRKEINPVLLPNVTVLIHQSILAIMRNNHAQYLTSLHKSKFLYSSQHSSQQPMQQTFFAKSKLLICVLILCTLVGIPPTADTLSAQTNTVSITEFMASNVRTIADEDGDYSDWIELYNSSSSTINLQGYTLSDDPNTLEKWVFPNVTLGANQYLIVFASNKNRAVAGSELHTNFKLSTGGEFLALTNPSGAIVTQFSPQYPSLGNDVSYGADANSQYAILDSPSPGYANGATGSSTLSVLPGSRSFVDSLQITLASQIPGATIRYTTNGSSPTASSTLYSGPVTISSRTLLKARAFFPNGNSSAVETHRYTLIQNSLANFSSNLPIVLIDTFGQTVTADSQTPSAIQFIEVGQDGRAAITGAPQLSAYGGINIRGALSATWDKKQYGIETWDEDNIEVDTSPLGFPAESDWIINGPYADKTLMKNVLVYGWWNEMGRYTSRTRFVEVYLNTGSVISSNDYVGVYVLLERVKRDDDRVDIEKLLPSDNSTPNVNGGFIWKVDDVEVPNSGFRSSQDNPNCNYYVNSYPRYEEITTAQQNAMRGFINQYENAIFSNSFANPETGYAKYIDVDSFIDYGIIQDFTQNTDGYHRSIFFHKSRTGKVNMGPIWDFNFSLGIDNRGLGGPTQPVTDRRDGSCWQRIYPRLHQDPEFEIKYWDRWFELRESVFDEAKLMAEINAHKALLDEAAARNYQTWTHLGTDFYDVTVPNSYTNAVDILKNWISARLAWFDSNGVKPPIFNQEGGIAQPGFQLNISRPTGVSGTIYYTLNGTDPRARGGSVAAGAQQYSGAITLNNSVQVMARVRTSDGWSAINREIFNINTMAAAGNFAITEIQYNPHAPSNAELSAGHTNADSFEFIELQNISGGQIDISQVSLADGITFNFADSDYLVIQPGERVLVVEDTAAFAARYGNNLPVAGQYTGKLSNSSETITLLDHQQVVIERVAYVDGGDWPGRADGYGSSLVRKSATTDGNSADNWKSSLRYGGTPGAAPEEQNTNVVINEVLAHTDPPLTDSIELFNSTATLIDVSHWYLSDSKESYKKYRVPSGSRIGAGGFIAFDEADFNNAGNPNNPTPFALSSSRGDDIYLVEADGDGNIIRFIDHIEFGATANAESVGRWPDGAEHFYPMQNRSLGASNASNGNSVRVGSIVISEIHYNPAGTDTNLEYIEIYNAGAIDQPLDNWRLRGEVDYNFPLGTSLAAGEAIVIVDFDPANSTLDNNFRTQWSTASNSFLYGPWTDGGQSGAKLSNGGGKIQLQRPDTLETPADGTAPFYPMLEEDTVRYDDDPPWTTTPDANGPALERIDAQVYGDDPANWDASLRVGGTPGTVTQMGDVSCDRSVDVIDTLFIMQGEVQLRTDDGGCPLGNPSAQLYSKMGDVNEDGAVNVIDALFIMQCQVEIANAFCP